MFQSYLRQYLLNYTMLISRTAHNDFLFMSQVKTAIQHTECSTMTLSSGNISVTVNATRLATSCELTD